RARAARPSERPLPIPCRGQRERPAQHGRTRGRRYPGAEASVLTSETGLGLFEVDEQAKESRRRRARSTRWTNRRPVEIRCESRSGATKRSTRRTAEEGGATEAEEVRGASRLWAASTGEGRNFGSGTSMPPANASSSRRRRALEKRPVRERRSKPSSA